MPSKPAQNRSFSLMAAFRAAHAQRDAKRRIDERDESGERVIAGRRVQARGLLDEGEARTAVARDLELLMNTVNLAASIDMHDVPAARGAIINHGFPDLVHRTIDEIGVDEIRYEIAAVLEAFEPRLDKGSIEVRRDDEVDALDLKIRFVVRADLRANPINLPVEFVADLERDTGKIAVRRS